MSRVEDEEFELMKERIRGVNKVFTEMAVAGSILGGPMMKSIIEAETEKWRTLDKITEAELEEALRTGATEETSAERVTVTHSGIRTGKSKRLKEIGKAMAKASYIDVITTLEEYAKSREGVHKQNATLAFVEDDVRLINDEISRSVSASGMLKFDFSPPGGVSGAHVTFSSTKDAGATYKKREVMVGTPFIPSSVYKSTKTGRIIFQFVVGDGRTGFGEMQFNQAIDCLPGFVDYFNTVVRLALKEKEKMGDTIHHNITSTNAPAESDPIKSGFDLYDSEECGSW